MTPTDLDTARGFRFRRVEADDGLAHWTVIDPHSTVLESADGYLGSIRRELEAPELTTRQYARNLAYFLTWAARADLDPLSAAGSLGSFASFLRSPAAQDETPLARPERIEQILATVRGFYIHLVREGTLPAEALGHLQEVVELGDRGVRSHSQCGEDLQIAHYIRKRERVTYVDVGCLWPRHFSNSYFFYERGGSGLCIDANPTVAEEFQRARPRDLFLSCGIAAARGTMTYHMHGNPVFNTLSATHAAELAQRAAGMEDSPQREGRELTATVEVPIVNVEEAVHSTGFAARCEDGRVDFLSIDVEGLELEVLSGFGFQALRPRLVVVEDVRRGAEARLELDALPSTQLMRAHRYRLAGHAGINLYFTDEDG